MKVPAKLIMGEKDYVLKFPGMEDFIRKGDANNFAADLEIVFMPQGTHFIHEQLPEEVNTHVLAFLTKHVCV